MQLSYKPIDFFGYAFLMDNRRVISNFCKTLHGLIEQNTNFNSIFLKLSIIKCPLLYTQCENLPNVICISYYPQREASKQRTMNKPISQRTMHKPIAVLAIFTILLPFAYTGG